MQPPATSVVPAGHASLSVAAWALKTLVATIFAIFRTSFVTIVVAGAGYGKSTLLGGWLERRNGAWYTLTAEDRDLDALAAGLLESLRLRVPGLARDLTVGLDSARGPEAETDGAARAPAFAALLCAALQEHLRSDLVLTSTTCTKLGRTTRPWR